MTSYGFTEIKHNLTNVGEVMHYNLDSSININNIGPYACLQQLNSNVSTSVVTVYILYAAGKVACIVVYSQQ